MPRTPEQYEQIRKEKRQQIMEAALELFAHDGYYNTPISKIAQTAGISKGLMYNYFESKEDLVISVMNQGMEILTDFLDPNKDGVLTDEEFDFFVIKSFDSLRENVNYWRLYFNLIMQKEVFELVMSNYQSVMNHTMNLLTSYFETRGVKDPASEAILFGSIMDGLSMAYILNPEHTDLDKLQISIIDKFGHKHENRE